jgi:hypothetical protein
MEGRSTGLVEKAPETCKVRFFEPARSSIRSGVAQMEPPASAVLPSEAMRGACHSLQILDRPARAFDIWSRRHCRRSSSVSGTVQTAYSSSANAKGYGLRVLVKRKHPLSVRFATSTPRISAHATSKGPYRSATDHFVRTSGICRLVGRFSSLSKPRPSMFRAPQNSRSALR